MLWRSREEMKAAIKSLRGRYLAGSRTQRWPFIFCFISKVILPGDKIQVFAVDDDYSFGLLQGIAHGVWYRARAARLKIESDYNYSSESVFETYPWPQSPGEAHVNHIAEAGRRLRRLRHEILPEMRGELRELYRTLELPGKNPLRDAHAALDAAVLAAYGFSSKKDLMAQLLELNLDLARREEAGEPVTAPGIPPEYPDPESLVTEDCICAD
jgi:hypothetical protein